jgi:hypothetical protein
MPVNQRLLVLGHGINFRCCGRLRQDPAHGQITPFIRTRADGPAAGGPRVLDDGSCGALQPEVTHVATTAAGAGTTLTGTATTEPLLCSRVEAAE